MSKYRQIAKDIEKDIISKRYTDKLPEQVELAKKYLTSRVTIVHALKVLQHENLIKTVKGHGTYIIAKTIPQMFLNSEAASIPTGFTSHVHGAGKLQNQVISFDIRKPTKEEAKALKIKKNDTVYDIIRQRILDDEPAKLEYTIMPTKVIPGVTEETLKGSIYHYIQDVLGLEIGKSDKIITADKPDAYDIRYLACEDDDPVLCIHQKVLLKDGRPFEFSETRNRYDRGSLTISGI